MKKTLAMILALCMIFALCACGQTAAPAPAQEAAAPAEAAAAPAEEAGEDLTWGFTPFAEPQTLRLGFFTGSPLSYPYLFADKLGVFDALNIDVEYTCFTGGPAMMEAGKDWDVCSLGMGGICIGLSAYDYTFIDVNDYEENMALFVRADSELAKDPTNPDLWKGAEVVYPTGTTAQMFLAAYLNSLGLTLADVTSTNADNANALTVFNGGTGDALCCWNAIALAADDTGYFRVSDAGQMGIPTLCGTFTHPDFLKNNLDLIATVVGVFHRATEWVYESDENMQQAADWYYEHCEEEGFLCTEEVALKTMQWFRGPTTEEYIAKFTNTTKDEDGLFTDRDILEIEDDILLGYDFFVSEGKYSPEQRQTWLTDARVDNSVALAVADMIG